MNNNHWDFNKSKRESKTAFEWKQINQCLHLISRSFSHELINIDLNLQENWFQLYYLPTTWNCKILTLVQYGPIIDEIVQPFKSVKYNRIFRLIFLPTITIKNFLNSRKENKRIKEDKPTRSIPHWKTRMCKILHTADNDFVSFSRFCIKYSATLLFVSIRNLVCWFLCMSFL